MNIRTFWTIFIKILGIWLVIDSLTVIPQFLITVFYPGMGNETQDFVLALVLLLLTVGIYFFILRLFVFNPDWLIDKLKLDQKFTEERIDLNISRPAVLSIVVMVVGGLMFINTLPMLCKHIFTLLQQKATFHENPGTGWLIFYMAKTLIGYLLMTNSQTVVGWIEKGKDKKEGTDQTE